MSVWLIIKKKTNTQKALGVWKRDEMYLNQTARSYWNIWRLDQRSEIVCPFNLLYDRHPTKMKDEWIIVRMVARSEALGASRAFFGEIQPRLGFERFVDVDIVVRSLVRAYADGWLVFTHGVWMYVCCLLCFFHAVPLPCDFGILLPWMEEVLSKSIYLELSYWLSAFVKVLCSCMFRVSQFVIEIPFGLH